MRESLIANKKEVQNEDINLQIDWKLHHWRTNR